MSAAKHTPGPWTAQRSVSTCPLSVFAGEKVVAFMGYEGDADAALIAAAPEMLAVLQQIQSDPMGGGWHKALDAVIARAKGLCARCGLQPGCPDCRAVHDVGAPE